MSSASVFIFLSKKINGENHVLLVKNKREDREKGVRSVKPPGWGLPGGQVEREEFGFEVDAVLRELQEETGIRKNQVEIDLTERESVHWENKYNLEDENDKHQVFIFRARLKVPVELIKLSPQKDSDVEEARWWPINKLPDKKLSGIGIYHSHKQRILDFLKV